VVVLLPEAENLLRMHIYDFPLDWLFFLMNAKRGEIIYILHGNAGTVYRPQRRGGFLVNITDKIIFEIEVDTLSPIDALAKAYDTLVQHDQPHEIETITIGKRETDGKYNVTVIARYICDEHMDPAWI
jgi:hypothetical protein